MTFETSLAGVGPHRWPLPSTTRTVLAPNDLMFANDVFWVGYQTYAWFTPRITKVAPLPSTTLVPSTCRPAETAPGRAATSAGYQRAAIFWMPVVLFGCTPSPVSAAVS